MQRNTRNLLGSGSQPALGAVRWLMVPVVMVMTLMVSSAWCNAAPDSEAPASANETPAASAAAAAGSDIPAPSSSAPSRPAMSRPETVTATDMDATTAAPASTDPLDDLPSYGEALIRMVVVLVSMLIALMLLARFLPRWLGRSLTVGTAGTIRVMDSLSLEPRKRVYLLKVGEQFFLVGTSEQGVHLLADGALDGEALSQLPASQTAGTEEAGTIAKGSTFSSFAAALAGKSGSSNIAAATGNPIAKEAT